jgi:protoporphyrinogen oxidase
VSSHSYDYCVVGAGPAGLTLAYRLLQAGQRVVMVERDARAGGLAKSYDYGGHIFDTGPKRFHTDDAIVQAFIREAGEMETIGRSTLVHFSGRYFNWPLNSSEMLKLPIATSIRVAIDLLRDKGELDPQSFRDFIRAQYGDTLYELFFRPYTQKFLHWDPSDLHSDWASTGINRTVIDKRVKANSLFDIVRALALPGKIETEFLYPSSGGFGGFFDRLLALCQQSGSFELITSDTIAALEERGETLHARTRGGRELVFETLVWSGNVKDIGRLVSDDEYDVSYLNTVFFNVICREESVGKNRAQWIYVSRGDSLVSRITCMREFTPRNNPAGYYNFICEVTDSQAEPRYMLQPERFTDAVLDEMVEMDFLRDRRGVEAVHTNPALDTYPIYHRRYRTGFGSVVGAVRKFSRRIHLLGRSGAYWYNNSDHSIRMAIDLSDKLLRDPEREFDHRAYFGGDTVASATNS